jgi:hypothetical protein
VVRACVEVAGTGTTVSASAAALRGGKLAGASAVAAGLLGELTGAPTIDTIGYARGVRADRAAGFFCIF